MTRDFTFRDYKANVFNRLDQDKDFFQVNVGEPGSGKSSLAFQLAWTLDPTFNADRMLFSGPRFVEVTSKLDAYPAGSAFVIDEAVIGAWAQSWASKENQDLAKYTMVFRERNFITFLNMPYLLDVGKPLKRRTHWLAEVEEVDDEKAKVTLFRKNKVRQFSKREPGFTRKLAFDFYPITPGSPMFQEWERYKRMKRESVSRFSSGMDAGNATRDRVKNLSVKARAILQDEGVPVV